MPRPPAAPRSDSPERRRFLIIGLGGLAAPAPDRNDASPVAERSAVDEALRVLDGLRGQVRLRPG
jgi:hypothetical protein